MVSSSAKASAVAEVMADRPEDRSATNDEKACLYPTVAESQKLGARSWKLGEKHFVDEDEDDSPVYHKLSRSANCGCHAETT